MQTQLFNCIFFQSGNYLLFNQLRFSEIQTELTNLATFAAKFCIKLKIP